MRAPIRVLCTLAAFLATFFFLNRFLGCPTNILTLLGLAGISFVAGGLVSDFVSGKEGNRAGLMAITAISAVLVAGSLIVGKPWDVGIRLIESKPKPAYFQMDAALYLLATEDNGPIENVSISFKAPTVDNKVPPSAKEGRSPYSVYYVLYYLDDNGNLLPQAETWDGGKTWTVYKFYGQRSQIPKILDHGIFLDEDGVNFSCVVDRLYPREVWWEVDFVATLEDVADKLTLKIYKDPENRSSGGIARYLQLGPKKGKDVDFDKKIWVKLFSRLSKPVDNKLVRVEAFHREYGPTNGTALWLYPLTS
jgi:hypothetical protein